MNVKTSIAIAKPSILIDSLSVLGSLLSFQVRIRANNKNIVIILKYNMFPVYCVSWKSKPQPKPSTPRRNAAPFLNRCVKFF